MSMGGGLKPILKLKLTPFPRKRVPTSLAVGAVVKGKQLCGGHFDLNTMYTPCPHNVLHFCDCGLKCINVKNVFYVFFVTLIRFSTFFFILTEFLLLFFIFFCNTWCRPGREHSSSRLCIGQQLQVQTLSASIVGLRMARPPEGSVDLFSSNRSTVRHSAYNKCHVIRVRFGLQSNIKSEITYDNCKTQLSTSSSTYLVFMFRY